MKEYRNPTMTMLTFCSADVITASWGADVSDSLADRDEMVSIKDFDWLS